jgi:phosphate transport system substrate-binding protein
MRRLSETHWRQPLLKEIFMLTTTGFIKRSMVATSLTPMNGISGFRSSFSCSFYKKMSCKALMLLVVCGLPGCMETQAPETGSVQVVGSETVRPLAEACASQFMDQHPESTVVVRGGGSGDGIAAVLQGVTEIGMASRDASAEERKAASGKGIELTEFDLAMDGIAVIINNNNPMAGELELSQLRELFAAPKPPNWKELNGLDKEILMYARGGSSGTSTVFQKKAMGGREYSPLVHRLLDNDAIVAAVATHPDAIGYTSLSALKHARNKVKVVALRANPQTTHVLPTAETVRSGAYPLARTLHLYTAGKPTGTVKSFIKACQDMGNEGLADKVGYIPMAAPEHVK